MDYYAHIRNPQGNILGGNNVSGPDATASKNKSKRDPDYMEIWLNATAKIWTTFATPGEAQMFHLKAITELIKNEMESLGIQDTNLMNKFPRMQLWLNKCKQTVVCHHLTQFQPLNK